MSEQVLDHLQRNAILLPKRLCLPSTPQFFFSISFQRQIKAVKEKKKEVSVEDFLIAAEGSILAVGGISGKSFSAMEGDVKALFNGVIECARTVDLQLYYEIKWVLASEYFLIEKNQVVNRMANEIKTDWQRSQTGGQGQKN